MKIWIDIDNPPQVRYLMPLARTAVELGHVVVVTARDYGSAYQILRDENVSLHPSAHASGGASSGRWLELSTEAASSPDP